MGRQRSSSCGECFGCAVEWLDGGNFSRVQQTGLRTKGRSSEHFCIHGRPSHGSTGSRARTRVFGLPSLSGFCLTFQFLSVKGWACFFFKGAEFFSKQFSSRPQKVHRRLCMQAKLCQSMPTRKDKQEL